jgi:rubrerythrin
MQYPQFRDALLRIAADESKHADWIAKKLNNLGESLPATLTTSTVEKNSWQYLLDDLEEERSCAADLETDMLTIECDYPDIAELLRRIDEEERKHRDEIREMLMRSDPQALWPA